MARGLMEGYANTTPTGFEGVGGNPAKSAVQTPDMNVVNQTAGTTDTGQPIEAASAVEKSFNNLSEESKANFAAVASNSTIAALKEFLTGMGMPPEEVAALDKIPTKDMIHISLDALIANPQQVMTQLQNVIAEVQGQATGMAQEGQTTDMAQADTGMMANEAATDRPPTQPV
jgi:ribosomal protein L10